nr:glycosyltransferase [uncultured Acetatifactor sp.]
MSMDREDRLFTGERFVPGIDDAELAMEHYQRYYSALPLVRGKKVLDAACGEGYGTALLAKAAAHVTGIDISPDAIARAKGSYSQEGRVRFIEGSIAELPLEDYSIDVVVSFETIEHVPEDIQHKFLDEIARVLKKDGFLIMSTPNKEVYSDRPGYRNEFHVKEFYREEFLGFLKGRFSRVSLFHQFFESACIVSGGGAGEADAACYCPEGYRQEAKYFIAVAGNRDIAELELSHVYINEGHDYERRIGRILQLQDEVEERNLHLKELDGEIARYREHIAEADGLWKQAAKRAEEAEGRNAELYSEKERLQKEGNALKQINAFELEENARLRQELEGLEEELIGLKDKARQQQAMIDEMGQAAEALRQLAEAREQETQGLRQLAEAREQEMEGLRQTIRNKEGHIELLLETEREYEREKRSRTYRMALAFRRISVFLLPVDSKRRFFCKLLAKAARHPIRMARMVNPRRIRNCFTILKTEGTGSASSHLRLVEEFERSGSVDGAMEKLDVTQVESGGEPSHTLEDYAPLHFELPEDPLVTIVIPVYNQFDYTYHCLESILKHSGDVSYEVLLADDCSTDLTREIGKAISGIRIVRNQENLRFLLNCNNAAAQARGRYILFLNNDTQVQENWLQPLVDLMESEGSIGMTGSKLIYPDGRLQEAGGILWRDASAWNYGHLQNPENPEYNYVKEADYISGAAIMIRRSLWEEIGGFDERFAPAYCEDSDLAFEVRRHGYKVVYQPLSVVVHFEGISNGTDLSAGQKKYQDMNRQKLYGKWKDVLEEQHFPNGEGLFLARDRGRGRKHILVIDHYVPQHDKDAGSKTTFMYLRMLVSKGYHITFLGDNFYRHEPYTTELQQMGILVLYGPRYAEGWKEWLSENMDCFDIFYLNRPHIAVKYIDFIRERARGKIIYYGHDLHFLRTEREYGLTKDVQKLKEARHWLEQETYIMRKADMNYYPSAIECDAIHAIDPSIPVKAITAYVYEGFEKTEYEMEQRSGILFVGGFGHTPNLDAVLWFLEGIYPEVHRRTNAPFYIVGSKAPESITGLAIDGVIVKGFVSEGELAELYHNARMAVVPLRYGAGVKGKVVEALYYGIPLVTTSVGAEGICSIEDAAIVKDAEQELIDAICSAYTDAGTLKEMSRKGQALARQSYSTDAVWDIIKEDF